jgi:hypothetical protein
MMSHNRPEYTQLMPPCGAEYLESMLETLDELHTAASEGSTGDFTDLNTRELIGVLREMMFLAQETIEELQKTRTQKTPVLRLVEKVHKAG